MEIRNNYSNQNFGMALKIKCGQDELMKCPKQLLEQLKDAGNKLKDDKFTNLEFYAPDKMKVGFRSALTDHRKIPLPDKSNPAVHLGNDLIKVQYDDGFYYFIKYIDEKEAAYLTRKLNSIESFSPLERGLSLTRAVEATEERNAKILEEIAREDKEKEGMAKELLDLFA